MTDVKLTIFRTRVVNKGRLARFAKAVAHLNWLAQPSLNSMSSLISSPLSK